MHKWFQYEKIHDERCIFSRNQPYQSASENFLEHSGNVNVLAFMQLVLQSSQTQNYFDLAIEASKWLGNSLFATRCSTFELFTPILLSGST